MLISVFPAFLLLSSLLSAQVTKYLEFKSVTGSFVVQSGKVHKVPATPSEALSSGLLGIFQKRRFRTFLQFARSAEGTASDGSRRLAWLRLFAHSCSCCVFAVPPCV